MNQLNNEKITGLWTEFEIDRLKQLFSEGFTDAQIASCLNRDVKSVANQRVKSIGSFLVRWKREELDTLRDLVAMGKSDKEIGIELNRSESSILHRRCKLNLQFIHRWTQDEKDEILKLKLEGYNYVQIAKIMGKNYNNLKQVVLRMERDHPVMVSAWTTEELEKLREMIFKMHQPRIIARKLSKDVYSVRFKIKELGLAYAYKGWTHDNDLQLIFLLDSNADIKLICEKLEIGPFYLLKRCKKLGIHKKYINLKNIKGSEKDKLLEKRMTNRFKSLKNRSKKKNLDINISILDLISLWNSQNGKCFYTGLDLDLRKNQEGSFSIDRKDNKFGYIKDNICFCRNDVNSMKLDKTYAEFLFLCLMIAKHDAKVNIF